MKCVATKQLQIITSNYEAKASVCRHTFVILIPISIEKKNKNSIDTSHPYT